MLKMRIISGLIFTGMLAAAYAVPSIAQTVPGTPEAVKRPSVARIVEDVPGPSQRMTRDLIRVSATKTPSGFRVPRYVSLKYIRSNGRTGPSADHPVKWQYKRKGLPMIVVAETETWRKVRDANGDETWMKRRLLGGTRMVLVRSEIAIRAKPRSDAPKRAIAAKGALLELDTCNPRGWCRVSDKDRNISGYALRSMLWGAEVL